MKGTTVAAELKRINPAVPIIVLSGMSDLPEKRQGWWINGWSRVVISRATSGFNQQLIGTQTCLGPAEMLIVSNRVF